MSWECICSYIIDNANSLMNAVRQTTQQNVCDDNGCYTNENSAIGLQTSDRPVSSGVSGSAVSNSMMLIVGLLVLYFVMSLFQNRVRSRASQANGALNKLNLRDNNDHNNDDHSNGIY